MDITAILALVEKGVSIIAALIEAGQSATPAIQALQQLVTGAKTGKITDAELDKTEAILDGMIDDFNLVVP